MPWRERKLRYRIFGSRGLDNSIAAEIGAIPHFSRSLYECVECSRNEKRLRPSRRFFAALRPAARFGLNGKHGRHSTKPSNGIFEALPSDIWQKDNLIVVVTITQNQILGLVRFLRAMPRDRLPRVVCQLMFPPSFVPWGAVSTHGKKFYRAAFSTGGAADRPLSFLHRRKRSHAHIV